MEETRQSILLQQDHFLQKPQSVSFLHGLESGLKGGKHRYLIANFDICYFKSMEMSKWKLNRRNSFLRTLFKNCFRPSLAVQDSLQGCLDIQRQELSQNRPDVILGSSWGGAIGLLLLSEGIWDGPIVLVAPALKYLLDFVGQTPKYKWNEIVSRINEKQLGHNIIIVHGTKDKVIPYQTALQMEKEIIGVKLITVKNGGHALSDYLIKKDRMKDHVTECFSDYQIRKRGN